MNIDASQCATKIIDVHGQKGVDWLARLPALVEEFAAHWSLTIQPPFPELSYNYVTPVVGPNGEAWVLKAGVPHDELRSEIDALALFDGHGIARLIASDRERGVLLLERVLPGDSLKSITDQGEQIAALVGVLQRLWRPLPVDHSFRTIAQLARGLDRLRANFGGYGPFPPVRVERAAALFRELNGAAPPPMLIHGDMNPGNVLRSRRDGWLAIDPKGYAGHPLFDVAPFLNDPPPLSLAELRRLQARRVRMLAEALDVSTADVLAWAEAHATLSSWWTYHDHGVVGAEALALAEMYESFSRAR